MADSYIGAHIKADRTLERSTSFIRITWRYCQPFCSSNPTTSNWRPVNMAPKSGSRLTFFFLTAIIIPQCHAVTIYYQPGQTPLADTTSTAAGATYTGLAAYNPVVLTPPPPPGPANLTTQFTLPLTNTVPSQASIQQSGSFFGFSIEMSVVNQVCESWNLNAPPETQFIC